MSGWVTAASSVEASPADRAAEVDRARPSATYPGFRMLSDGTSMVWLYVDRPVDVSGHGEGRMYTIDLPNVQVGVRNNTNPLVTTHFPTPLARAWLRSQPGGAKLVLELKKPLVLEHKVETGPRNTMIVSVTLPPLAPGQEGG